MLSQQPLVTLEQMKALEKKATQQLGLSELTLMENAGRGLADFVKEHHPKPNQIVIMAGPGNNGGDGMVTARYLHNWGFSVLVMLAAKQERLSKVASVQYQAIQACKIPIQEIAEADLSWLSQRLQSLSSTDVLIDALFGTGVTRPLEGFFQKLVLSINQSPAFVISVDIPSGLEANQGLFPGSSSLSTIVKAQATVTFAFPKVGMVNSPGFTYVGALHIVDIGIPSQWVQAEGGNTYQLDETCLAPLLEQNNPLAHKGTHGHLGLMAGSVGKTGAGLLSALGAIHMGVGLCTWLVPKEIMDVVSGKIPEVMTAAYQLPQACLLESKEAQLLIQIFQDKEAWVIGPGISTEPEMEILLWHLLEQGTCPVVLDADALNHLAKTVSKKLEAKLKVISQSRNLIITPHPGEAARLLQTHSSEIQANRLQSAIKLYHLTGAVVVLKGARTIIVGPDEMAICPTGNQAMGTGGMGDVLAGMIGALLARGFPAYQAACMAVYLHGKTGDRLATSLFPGSLLQASHLAQALSQK